MTSHLVWYTARGSGIVAWALVSASILCGLALAGRIVAKPGASPWLLDLHRHLAVMSIAFTGIHLLGLWLDTSVHFGLAQLFVPMAAAWRPGAIAWGIVAFYVMVAVQLSSWAMRRIGRRVWHAIHLTSFGLFVSATIHLWQAGTDHGNAVLRTAAVAVITTMVFLVVFRVAARRPHRHPIAQTP